MKRIIFLLLSCIVIEGSINAAEPRENDYPLHEAVESGKIEQVASLLECSNINVNEQDTDGMTPLHIAARDGYIEIARLLIKHQANSNLADDCGDTPLAVAAINGHEAVVLLLLGCSNDLVKTKDYYNHTPLHMAVHGGHVSIVRLLLEHGADANAQDGSLKSPLHYAVSESEHDQNYNYRAIFCLLLIHGADQDLKDDDGKTPLDCADGRVKQIFNESEQMVKRMRAVQLTICSAMHQRLGCNSFLQHLGALPVLHIAQCLQSEDF